jgi:hypothetical protein
LKEKYHALEEKYDALKEQDARHERDLEKIKIQCAAQTERQVPRGMPSRMDGKDTAIVQLPM